MVPSMVNEIYIIRLAVCAKYANDDDMRMAFTIIQEHADIVLAEYSAQRNGRQSSSNDSLELISKQLGTNGEHEAIVPENNSTSAEKTPETVDTSAMYPATKARVRRSFRSNRNTRRLFSGEHYHDHDTTSPGYI
jgi:hypothetical protein